MNFARLRAVPINTEHLDTYAKYVSAILHMEVPKIIVDTKGFLEKGRFVAIINCKGSDVGIVLRDTSYIYDVGKAGCIYYMMSMVLYHYCEGLGGCNFASSIAIEDKDDVWGMMSEEEFSELNAHAFACLCIENFTGIKVALVKDEGIVFERADEMRGMFSECVLDAFFKSFSDIIGQ